MLGGSDIFVGCFNESCRRWVGNGCGSGEIERKGAFNRCRSGGGAKEVGMTRSSKTIQDVTVFIFNYGKRCKKVHVKGSEGQL